MRKYNSRKRNLYYDEVIRLYYQKGMSGRQISQILPIGTTAVSEWIRNFALNNPDNEYVVMNKFYKSEATKKTVSQEVKTPSLEESTDIKQLQKEIAQLKKQLRNESMRADLYNEIINVAEKKFNISIRKKTGTKQ